MAESYTEMYLHIVWTTFRRKPWLVGELKQRLYLAIAAEARRQGAPVIALGGIEDHVRLLVRLPPTVAVSHLVKQIKGSSSHLIRDLPCGDPFRWQAGYGGFTITKSLSLVVTLR
jgi:REP element-mobilizing transposase RayT